MALTSAQKLSCYEILGVTAGPGGGANADAAVLHNAFGISLSLSEMDGLRDSLDLYLDNLAAAHETKVAAIVAEWDALGFHVGSIDGGSIGDLQGASLSFDAIRQHLRERLQIYVPVLHMLEAVRKRAGGERGFVEFIR
jgi:hypothetical protein